MRRVDMQLIILQGNQPLTLHLICQRINNVRQLVAIPAQEQLRFQHWVKHIDVLHQYVAGDVAMLGDNCRHQRRQHQHMRNVVAIVGHQHRLLAWQNDDVADSVFLDFKLVHLQRVIDKLAGAG